MARERASARQSDRTVEAIVELLTPAQRAQWQMLAGAPFAHDLGFLKDDSFLW